MTLEAAPAETEAEASAQPLPHLDGVSVLVVDDDVDSRSFVCQLLEHHGATVSMSDSTSDALSRFRQLRPDVSSATSACRTRTATL